jgi:hypothetical protein
VRGWDAFAAAIDRRSRGAAAFALVLLAFLGIGASSAVAQSPPALSVTGSSEVGVTSARLEGEVNPEGEAGSPPTYFQFEVSADNGSGEPDGNWIYVGGNPDGEISGAEAEEANPIAVEGIAESLQPATTYYIRLVADNAEFSNHVETDSPYPSFTTEPAATPVLATQPATAVGYSSAVLHGTVDPEGGNVNPVGGPLPIYWSLQYREAGVFGPGEGWAEAPCPPAGCEISGAAAEESAPIAVEAELPPGSLPAGKSFEVRLFAYYLSFSRSAESPEPFEAFETEAAIAPAVTIEGASAITGTGAHFAGHVELANSDPAFNTTVCEFDYVSDAKFTATEWAEAQHAACNPGTVTGAGSTEVSADPANLLPGVTYHLRLRAENQAGADEAVAGAFTTPPLAPAIGHTFVSVVGEGVATLNAEIDPRGATTTVHFEYVTQEAFEATGFAGATSTPESAPIGSDNQEHLIQAPVTGLSSGTSYRYRAVATNTAGTSNGPDRGFRTAAAPEGGEETCPNAARRAENSSRRLPDCRAYELVSPPDKNGGDVSPDTSRTRAAQGLAPGEPMAVQFTSHTAFGDARGGGISIDYMAIRDAQPLTQGWGTHAITPQQNPMPVRSAANQDPAYEGNFSPDLSTGVFRAFSPLTDEDPNVANIENLYLRSNLRSPGAGSYQLLTPCPGCTAPLGNTFFQSGSEQDPRFVGASADFSHVIFESAYGLTADAPGCSLDPSALCPRRLYEWEGGSVRPAGVLPDGSVPTHSIGGSGMLEPNSYVFNAISADGRKVFFTDASNSLTEEEGNLYMRLDHSTTVQLNASERTDCADHDPCSGTPEPDPLGHSPVQFMSAATDGSRVFFTSEESLTDDAVRRERQLYMYDTSKPASDPHNLTLISRDGEPADGLGGIVGGILGQSNDGRWIYFVNLGQLVAGAPANGDNPRIFLWHDGTLRYVGALTGGSDAVLHPLIELNAGQHFAKPSRVSPDGRHLLFTDLGDPVFGTAGYDQGDCSVPPSPSVACVELYLYDAGSGSVNCVSCNPDGAPATADARVTAGERQTDGRGSAHNTNHLNNPMTADGKRVFFSTAEALVPEDTNGTEDAYEYDAANGKVSLLSSGTDPHPSFFEEATPDGKDVFIRTAEQLVGWDHDNNYDLYDVRVDGGFPEPVPVPAPCSGDNCHPGSRLPAAPGAGSAAFQGPGNHGVKCKHKKSCHKRKCKHKKRCDKARHHRHQHNHRGGAK